VVNRLYYGDNLDILRRREYFADASVDLVYLDPPFKSDQDYNVLFQEKDGSRAAAQIKAFSDTWEWNQASAAACDEVIQIGGRVSDALRAFKMVLGGSDMMAYLAMMAPRLLELRRVLKPTGSLYLHCDPTASHYLKLLLDSIFGPENFRSEVIWRRSNGHNKVSRQFGPIHDTLLFYARSNDAYFRPGLTPVTRGYVREWFTAEDEHGAFRTNMLTGPGTRTGASGRKWRNFDPTSVGRHWAIPASLRDALPPEASEWDTQQCLDHLYDAGLIYIPRDGEGQPKYKQYVGPGIPYQDVWAYQPYTQGCLYGTEAGIDEDVKWLQHDQERLGYPTQKPEGLLARIIESSCPSDGVVLDPFCGCGTSIAAAQQLHRAWIGIDITHLAITLIRHRLSDAHGESIRETYSVTGEPVSVPDAEELAATDPYQFQWWALGLVGARPTEQKKGADKGIDGRIFLHEVTGGETQEIVLSVKAGHTGPNHVSELRGVMEREGAIIGVLITMQEPTRAMIREAASGGFYESRWGRHPRLQILQVGELLDGAQIDCPPVRQTSTTYRRAPRVASKSGSQPRLHGLDVERTMVKATLKSATRKRKRKRGA
jgi:site-specific DNA-methyltransferase (adenine-specific)